jgi:SAM-dependent methyltransferase
MKRCLACGSTDVSADWHCESCGSTPPCIDGFVAFSPKLAAGSSGFKPEYFQQLADVESGNFWFVARNRLIAWAAKRYFRADQAFCEIGCGTGYVLRGLASAFPRWKLFGTEIYADGLSFAARRVGHAQFYQMDARHVPFDQEFDVVGAFDVLEHIEDDVLVLREIHRALRPEGGLIITVPQHPFLWSQQDEHACHVRRYRASDILGKLERNGFKIEFASSFVSLLLPLMYMTRVRARASDAEYDAIADLRLSPVANRLLGAAMTVERTLIKAGLRLPFGGSLLIVARRVAGS